MRTKLLILLSFSALFVSAQSPFTGGSSSDAATAIELQLEKNLFYTCPQSPAGPGEVADIRNTEMKYPYMVKSEHHSAWYVFESKHEGDIAMDIVPLEPGNDYDYMLFKYNGSASFIADIASGKILPVSANISHNTQINSTGMKVIATKTHVGIGPGDAFSKAIHAYPGEKYYLLVDNITDNGKGFNLYIYYQKLVHVSGNVSDEESHEGLATNVVVENTFTGSTEIRTISDIKGQYDFDLPMAEDVEYHIYYLSNKYFFKTKTISTKDVKEGKITNIRAELPRLTMGMAYRLENINFVGDEALVLSISLPSLKTLGLMMQNNPSLKIRICGYVNGCERGPAFVTELSEKRAETVYRFLTRQGIDQKRLDKIGFGCMNMVYPNPKNEWENEQNRRVEIQVVEY